MLFFYWVDVEFAKAEQPLDKKLHAHWFIYFAVSLSLSKAGLLVIKHFSLLAPPSISSG
jgi:hypothetical protein